MKTLCFFFLIFICKGISFAQFTLPVFHHLNTADGLSGNRVKCIIQDKRGFMWFGTDAGLNRYDGREFITFRNNPSDSNSISGNDIRDLLEDDKGLLWIATGDGGLSSYNYRTARFKQYHIPLSGSDAVVSKAVNAIAESGHTKLWIATDKVGLYLFDKVNGTFQLLSQTLSKLEGQALNKAYAYFDVTTDSDNVAYFGTLGYSLQIFKEEMLTSANRGNSYPYPAHTVNCIFIDKKQRVWLGAWDNALHAYNRNYNSINSILLNKNEQLTYSGDEIISINEDEKGWLWIGTRHSGLFLFNPETQGAAIFANEIFNVRKNFSDEGSLSSNTIRIIYRDQQNRMWLGTDAGIDVYDPLLQQFEIFRLTDIVSDATEDETVYDFLEDANRIYIATSKGLIFREGVSFTRKTFLYENDLLSVTKIFKDHNGIIYLGTNKSVFKFNPEDLSIETFNCSFHRSEDDFDFFNIPSSRIVAMTEGEWNGHHVLWICPYGHGVGVFDTKTLSGLVSTLNIPDNMENLVRKVYVDSENNTWLLCSSKGLGKGVSTPVENSINRLWSQNRFLSKTSILDSAFLRTEFIHDDAEASNNLYDMIGNDDGTYWITSQDGGLYLFRPSNTETKFSSFHSDHSSMNGLMKDKNENLWIITGDGIEFFDVKKKSFHYFGSKEGIPNEGIHGYFYQGDDGYAYAGGNGYFIRFRPEKIRFNLAPPSMALTHFKIFDQPADSLLLKDEIQLSYRENFFSFEFAALNFTNAASNQFAFMLEGVDHDWVQSGTRNFASYTNLRGGRYQFRVKASNNFGAWNEQGISIPVYIRPPVWQQWWFYPVIFLMALSAGVLFYRNRIARIHHQQEERLRAEIEAQEHERIRIAQDLHDDFGTRISALKIYMSTLEKHIDMQNEEAMMVKENAKAIVNDAMSDLRTLLMNLSPKTLEMHGYYAAVHDLVNRLNHTGMFDAALHVDPELNRFDKKYELALYRITQELLNNSIKHSSCTEIDIQLLRRNGLLVLNYNDNGKGFDQALTNIKGFGLKNIENRVSLLDGKIIWDTAPGKGLSVVVEVPMG